MELPGFIDELQPTHKRICVIGAGPAGLAALKVILDTSQYKSGLWKPIAFEARDNVGGVWLPASPAANDPPLTPLYDSLTTNLPHPLMVYSGHPFPPSTPVYPHASLVQKYLASYTEHFGLLPHIRLNTIVESVDRRLGQWQVQVSTGETFTFDLVIICNGHHRVPHYPNAPGLGDWLKEGRATHSAWYRYPHTFGDIVLVVGAGPSGRDISEEMLPVSKTVIHSVSNASNEDIGKLKRRGRITKFEKNGRVTFEDGTCELGIDHCILATGYETSFPFLPDAVIHSAIPPLAPPLPSKLYNTTYGVFPLARHIFPLQNQFPNGSLAFMGLLIKVVPFPLFEAQARAIIHVFVYPEALESTQEAIDVITRHEELRTRFGDDPSLIAKQWHRFQPLEQFEYRDQLHEFVAKSFNITKVPRWEKVMYLNKDVLRIVWRDMESSGEADGWVKGVGEKGIEEWVALLERMLDRARGRGLPVIEFNQGRL
ncbi:hypothetical protein AX17_002463 [Amanita inopinata Kibby_2008]|nr:hypothetical protein AX17_002463 [Amanita inopinata Kibby_2008]